MSEQRIEPHKVTKPIQLLAAWLVGLCVLNVTFLGAAAVFKESKLASFILIGAAVLNVPVFLYSLFLLQTKYRPEMQEDTFYSTYLNRNTNAEVEIVKPSLKDRRLDDLRAEIILLRNQISHLNIQQQASGTYESCPQGLSDWNMCRIALNDLHPDFLAIRKALKTANIPVMSIFGTVNKSEPPEKLVLSVDVDSSDILLLRKALKELLKFSFDGISLTERNPDIGEEEHIYVGSYGFGDGYAPITDELRDLVESGIDPIDIKYHVSKNLIKPVQ